MKKYTRTYKSKKKNNTLSQVQGYIVLVTLLLIPLIFSYLYFNGRYVIEIPKGCGWYATREWDLNYYNNKKNGEVDFILEQNGKVVPIEVKSGKDYNRHQALNNLLNTKEYDIDEAIVFGQINLHIKDKVLYAPIYMVMFLDKRQPTDEMIYKPDIDAIR